MKIRNVPILLILLATLLCSQGFAKQPKLKRPLLITGCARSGTAYITRFLRLNGLDVGHERNGAFGVVSWVMAVNAKHTPWGPGAAGYKFEHVFHQVRHPLKTIASAGNEPDFTWEYVEKYIPGLRRRDPKIVKGALYWYHWNLFAENKAEWTYRIEDIENQVEEMSLRLGVDLDATRLQQLSKTTHTRGYKEVYTWKDLKNAVDESLYNNIVQMAIRYGYDVEAELEAEADL